MARPYRLAFNRFVLWLRRSMSFLWLVVVAAYLCVMAGQAVYRNYQSQQDIVSLQKQLADATQERERLQALLVYYQTDDYKEKELRRDFLLQMPGEKVYALPESAVGALTEEQQQAAKRAEEQANTLPIWRQWIDYLVYGRQDA